METSANNNPDIVFDATAFEKMTPAQIADLFNRWTAAIESRLQKIEPLVGTGKDQVEIDTDENIGNEVVGNKISLWLEADKARENIGMAAGAGGGGGGPNGFMRWGRIVSSNPTAVVDARGNPVQWLYAIQQLKPGPTPSDPWENDVDGYIGEGRNAKEVDNTGMDVQGNGIDFDGAIFTDNPALAMQPIREMVPFWLVTYQDDTVAAQFSEPNAVDGVCGSGS